jgi:hypothetical protein
MLKTKVIRVDTSRGGVKLTLEPAAGGDPWSRYCSSLCWQMLEATGAETDGKRFKTNVSVNGLVMPSWVPCLPTKLNMLVWHVLNSLLACWLWFGAGCGLHHPEVASDSMTEEQVRGLMNCLPGWWIPTVWFG